MTRKSPQRLAIESELLRAKDGGYRLNLSALARELQVPGPFVRTVARQFKSPRPSGGARFGTPHAGAGRKLPWNHEALRAHRTLFPGTVRPAGYDGSRLLMSGENQPKLGPRSRRGRWRGMPIYALTLEERATCPTSCRHWGSCYGNNMPFARRWDAASEHFQRALVANVAALAAEHPRGFIVRLHVLGDFFSVAYVRLWLSMMERFPMMRVFGFTARTDRADQICRDLVCYTLKNWDRFALRFSNAPIDECSTVTIEHPYQRPADAILCPAQIGKTESCSTCGLCWQTKRRIAFLQH